MIYLDHNATTPCIFSSADLSHLLNKPLNPSSVHSFGRFAKGVLENARREICGLLGANLRDYSLVFTGSGTEANNLILQNFQHQNVFALAIEHVSILDNPNIQTIDVDSHGVIRIDHLIELLQNADTAKKTLVCVMLANNETGVLQPLEKVRDVVKKYGASLHSDCIQGFGKIPINIDYLGADSISISAHKVGGLPGIGALIYKNSMKIVPQIRGGGQEMGMRGGTENVVHAYLFAKAATHSGSNIENYLNNVLPLRDYIEEQIKSVCSSARFASSLTARLPNTSNIIMSGVSSQIQLMRFDLDGFAVSSGAACSSGKVKKSHVLKAMGMAEQDIESAVRVSFGPHNTLAEANAFVKSWSKIYQELG